MTLEEALLEIERLNKVIEFKNEEIEALKKKNDGKIRPFMDGYYTDHYELMEGKYSRVFRGRTVLKFKKNARITPFSREDLSIILSQTTPEEVEELLITLDSDKAFALYEGFVELPLIWNKDERTITVEFYCLETEDTLDADRVLYYKCAPFAC